MVNQISPRTLRHLSAAEGYLELDLPALALEELADIEAGGPLEALVELMKGRALMAQAQYEAAMQPLRRATQLMPALRTRGAWLTLSECFRRDGRNDLADMAEKLAESTTGSAATGGSQPSSLTIKFVIEPPEMPDEGHDPSG